MSNSTGVTGHSPSDSMHAIDVDGWRTRIKTDTFARYHLGMGEALEREGSADVALAAYRRAIDTLPGLAVAHLRLTALLRRLNRPAEAEAAHRAALSLDPVYEAVAWKEIGLADLLDERVDAALPALERSAAAMPDDVAAAAYRAVALIRSGRVAQARSAIAALAPASAADAHEIALNCLWPVERFLFTDNDIVLSGEALLELTELAVTLAPRDPKIIDRSCLVRLLYQRPDSILHLAQRAGVEPHWPKRCDIYKGWAHLLLSRWADAEAVFRSVLESDLPYDAFVSFALAGLSLTLFAKGQESDALDLLSRDLDAHPNTFWPLRTMGQIELAAGRFDTALPLLRAAEEANSRYVTVQADIALCELMRGNVELAGPLLESVRAAAGTTFRLLMPDDPWVLIGSALTCAAEGRQADAERLVRDGLAPHLPLLPFFATLLPAKARATLDALRGSA